jgi:hypothetical protein
MERNKCDPVKQHQAHGEKQMWPNQGSSQGILAYQAGTPVLPRVRRRHAWNPKRIQIILF